MRKRRCFFRGSSAANLGCVWTTVAQLEGASPTNLSECGRWARVLRDSLSRQPDCIDPSSRFAPNFRCGYLEKEARGLELLKEWLSPEQLAQYDAKSYFESPAATAERDTVFARHRDEYPRTRRGRPRVGWCFAPKGHLVAGDVMLAPASTKVRMGSRPIAARCKPSSVRTSHPRLPWARSGTERGAAWFFLPAGLSRSCAAIRRLCIENSIITDQPQFAIAPMAVSARRMRPNVRGPLRVN